MNHRKLVMLNIFSIGWLPIRTKVQFNKSLLYLYFAVVPFCLISLSPKSISGELNLSQVPIAENLRSVLPSTKAIIISMPILDRTGSSPNLASFGTEVLNQSLLNGGVKLFPWFKMEVLLKQHLTRLNPYVTVSSSNLLSDGSLMDLIKVGKKNGVSYILRPVLLKKSLAASAQTQQTGWGYVLGGSLNTQIFVDSEIDLKVDIIDVKSEDIVGSKTFSGRSRSVTKERANTLDGIIGQSIVLPGNEQESYQAAFYDTVDKVLDFLLLKLSSNRN